MSAPILALDLFEISTRDAYLLLVAQRRNCIVTNRRDVMQRYIVSSLLFLALSASASAAGLSCSIRPGGNAASTALQDLAKVTKAEAQNAALGRIKSSSTKIE